MKMLRFAAFVALLLAAGPAFAQWQTPTHSVPIGEGIGVTGFNSAAPGTAGNVFISNGAASDPSFSLFSAICPLAPAACTYALGYTNVVWYGVKCDGTTDDTVNLDSAFVAAAGLVIVFPAGQTCITGATNICLNVTCANSATRTAAFPSAIYGNGATLKSRSGTTTPLFYVENPPSGFVLDGLNFNANAVAPTGIQVFGSQFATYRNINVTGATGDGCLFTGTSGYGFYYNVVQRVACGYNINNSSNSNGNIGAGDYTLSTISPTGTPGCYMATAYNASNTFIDVSAAWNGGRGIDINCANNSYYGASFEQNLGVGVAIANSLAVDLFGGHSESNDCARCGAGTGGDVSFFGVGSNPGVSVFGGRHTGTFSGVNSANNDIVQSFGVAGVGFATVSGHQVVTVP